ncbi:MAG: hypothetical protein IIV48_06865 [Clostridium sp.]|nr:hypothetical protein [Clostridium sp.]
MERVLDNEMSVYEWLDFFSSHSNHWVFKYWKNNSDIFFNRFMILGNYESFIVCDKSNKYSYEFKKPKSIQINLWI